MRTTEYDVVTSSPSAFSDYVWKQLADSQNIHVEGISESGEKIKVSLNLFDLKRKDETLVLILDSMTEAGEVIPHVSARIKITKETVKLSYSDVNASPDEAEAVVTRIDRRRHR